MLKTLQHDNIVKLLDYGSNGVVKKANGKTVENIVYLKLEFISGGLLFDVCQSLGAMGEDKGRFFMS